MNSQRSISRTCKLAIILAILVVVGVLYSGFYYWTTSFSIGTPLLDWYAYRDFKSKAHLIVFLPMFRFEQRFGHRNAEYTLIWRIEKPGQSRGEAE